MVEHACATGKSQSEILASHSSKELTEKMIYLQLYPMNQERADLRAGIIASTIANVNRGKGQSAFKAEDFMPKFGQMQSELTDEQMEAKLSSFGRAFGGRTGKLSDL